MHVRWRDVLRPRIGTMIGAQMGRQNASAAFNAGEEAENASAAFNAGEEPVDMGRLTEDAHVAGFVFYCEPPDGQWPVVCDLCSVVCVQWSVVSGQ